MNTDRRDLKGVAFGFGGCVVALMTIVGMFFVIGVCIAAAAWPIVWLFS